MDIHANYPVESDEHYEDVAPAVHHGGEARDGE